MWLAPDAIATWEAVGVGKRGGQPAECLTSHRQATALGVGQAKRSRTKMLPEDTILLPERVDAIFLVASHPASHGQHEEVQSVGHGRRLYGSDTAVTHVVSGIHSPWPFSRTIRDRTITLVKTLGRRRWKKASGYPRQGRVENTFFRYKSIIGDGLRARRPAGQGSEVVLGCEILNRMTALGRPVSYRIGR